MSYQQDIQKLYIAYYGRPADPAGLTFWTDQLNANGGNLNSIIDAFATSAEAQAKYGDKSGDALIAALYQSILGRAPDADGLAFYSNELAAGQISAGELALTIETGVQNGDAHLLDNKLAVADQFTTMLAADSAKAAQFNGAADIALAAKLLDGVTADSTLETWLSSITDSVNAVENDGSGSGNGGNNLDGSSSAAGGSDNGGSASGSSDSGGSDSGGGTTGSGGAGSNIFTVQADHTDLTGDAMGAITAIDLNGNSGVLVNLAEAALLTGSGSATLKLGSADTDLTAQTLDSHVSAIDLNGNSGVLVTLSEAALLTGSGSATLKLGGADTDLTAQTLDSHVSAIDLNGNSGVLVNASEAALLTGTGSATLKLQGGDLHASDQFDVLSHGVTDLDFAALAITFDAGGTLSANLTGKVDGGTDPAAVDAAGEWSFDSAAHVLTYWNGTGTAQITLVGVNAVTAGHASDLAIAA